MQINNTNINLQTAQTAQTAWNSNAAAVRTEKIDFSKPKTLTDESGDRFVLNLPVSETVYERTEFVTDESMGKGCAFCYTYMERTLTFGNEKYGISTVSSNSSGGYFAINFDSDARTFGKSGTEMNNIEHAVEENRERKDRTLEQSTINGSLSGLITGNDWTAGGSLEFAVKNTVYKYSNAGTTKGTVSYKNGGIGNYRETSLSSREIYNKCAIFLAEAFGGKSSDLVLSEKAFNELFERLDGDEKAFPEKAAQKREKLAGQLSSLKEFMEKNLSDVRKKAPDCGSLKTFADTYLKLGTYKYSELTSLAEKFLQI